VSKPETFSHTTLIIHFIYCSYCRIFILDLLILL